jgi:hypothetical protein
MGWPATSGLRGRGQPRRRSAKPFRAQIRTMLLSVRRLCWALCADPPPLLGGGEGAHWQSRSYCSPTILTSALVSRRWLQAASECATSSRRASRRPGREGRHPQWCSTWPPESGPPPIPGYASTTRVTWSSCSGLASKHPAYRRTRTGWCSADPSASPIWSRSCPAWTRPMAPPVRPPPTWSPHPRPARSLRRVTYCRRVPSSAGSGWGPCRAQPVPPRRRRRARWSPEPLVGRCRRPSRQPKPLRRSLRQRRRRQAGRPRWRPLPRHRPPNRRPDQR